MRTICARSLSSDSRLSASASSSSARFNASTVSPSAGAKQSFAPSTTVPWYSTSHGRRGRRMKACLVSTLVVLLAGCAGGPPHQDGSLLEGGTGGSGAGGARVDASADL